MASSQYGRLCRCLRSCGRASSYKAEPAEPDGAAPEADGAASTDATPLLEKTAATSGQEGSSGSRQRRPACDEQKGDAEVCKIQGDSAQSKTSATTAGEAPPRRSQTLAASDFSAADLAQFRNLYAATHERG